MAGSRAERVTLTREARGGTVQPGDVGVVIDDLDTCVGVYWPTRLCRTVERRSDVAPFKQWRATGNVKSALERLETVTGKKAPDRGSLAHRLSVLAHTFVHGKAAGEIRDLVRWAPARIPVKGMVGWQIDALERLSTTFSAGERKQRRAAR